MYSNGKNVPDGKWKEEVAKKTVWAKVYLLRRQPWPHLIYWSFGQWCWSTLKSNPLWALSDGGYSLKIWCSGAWGYLEEEGRERKGNKMLKYWASLVAQWLRICLPMQGTRVRALVWEDPTCRGATGPVHHNYWAWASGASAPQQERLR